MREDLSPLEEVRGSRRGPEAETTLEMTDIEKAAAGTATGREGVTLSVDDV